MDRCVILVDVGYLLAEGGKTYCGATKRSQVRCDYAGTSGALEDLAADHSQLPLLRSYWYDGAPDYVMTQDHHVIAGLPRVKLRLGRLVERKSGREQKGVDSLIVHDLITLAQERAVSTVFLLAGDEDLREGVAAAQRLGVQVILVGIPTTRPNQSDPLIREADEVVLVEDRRLKSFFDKAGFQPGAEEEAPLSTDAKTDPAAAVATAGRSFAANWARAAGLSEVGELLAHEPRIPKELDVQLLLSAEETVGISLRGEEDLRRGLRSAFWEELAAQARSEERVAPKGERALEAQAKPGAK